VSAAIAAAACEGYQVADPDAGGAAPHDAAGRADASPPDAGLDAAVCPTRYGAAVIEVAVGGTGNQATDAERAEGAPNCGEGGGGSQSLSLGGGHITLDIGCLYQPAAGADLRVWEASDIYPPCYGQEEMFAVEVSVDGASWTDVGDGSGPTAFEVADAFRYVRISDPLTPDDSITPGADIDSLELLQAP
jgi:hypothetical protein